MTAVLAGPHPLSGLARRLPDRHFAVNRRAANVFQRRRLPTRDVRPIRHRLHPRPSSGLWLPTAFGSALIGHLHAAEHGSSLALNAALQALRSIHRNPLWHTQVPAVNAQSRVERTASTNIAGQTAPSGMYVAEANAREVKRFNRSDGTGRNNVDEIFGQSNGVRE